VVGPDSPKKVISPGSPVIHARRVVVQYWISSPGYMGAPVRASLPLNFAFMVLIMVYPLLCVWYTFKQRDGARVNDGLAHTGPIPLASITDGHLMAVIHATLAQRGPGPVNQVVRLN